MRACAIYKNKKTKLNLNLFLLRLLGGGAMLEIRNITIQTHKGRTLINNLSFVLNKNDKIAIIGEEGNGKSTLLKAIINPNLIQDYVSIQGDINKNGYQCGYLSQTLDLSWNDTELFEFIVKKKPSEGLDPSYYNDISKVVECLSKVDFDSSLLFENRLMESFSGGEKVKIQLAKILYEQPDILLLDEPTNDLDLKTLIWLEEFIKEIDRPVLFITHDEVLLENTANGILHLEQLKRKTSPVWNFEHCGYIEYCERRNYNIQRTNRIASKEKAEYEKQLERYRQIYQRVDHELNSVSRQNPHGGQLLKKKMRSVKALGKRLEDKELTHKIEPEEAIEIFFDECTVNRNKIILDLELPKLQVDDRTLCKDIRLLVKGNEHIVLIGQNGTGKTTLLKHILQLLQNRKDITVGYLPQNYGDLLPTDISPVEFLLKNQEYEMKSKIQSYLGSLKFTSDEMEHKIKQLSYGQRCKVMLIHLVINQFNVLLLDEPTRNLSPLSNPVIRKIFGDFGGCIISISHDRKFIDEVCDTVYEISNQSFIKMD